MTYSSENCGSAVGSANLTSAGVEGVCGEVRQGCAVQVDAMSPAQRDKSFEVATVAHVPGLEPYVSNYVCDATAGRAVPVVTPALARAQVVRLLPVSRVGVAPVDLVTLVRIDTLFWVGSRAELDLGTVRLLGQRVGLRAHMTGVEWDFGDGSVGHTDGPGVAFPAGGPCRTVHCPAYFSHDYVSTGRVGVSARVTWAGQFRVGGGAWQDIAQPVSLRSPTVRVRVREARAVLTG